MEVDRAQVDGGEVGGVEREVGRVLGAARVVAHPVAARVPGTELVGHLQHDGLARAVRARLQRRVEVDEPQPQPVAQPHTERARIANEQR